MNQLTTRERRLVALALLLAVGVAFWLLIVSPLLTGFISRADARQRLADELARNGRLISSLPTIRLEAARAERDASAFALPTSLPAQAADMARARFTAAVEGEGGELRSLRLQPSSPRRVRLQADLRMGWIGLTRLVRRLETDRPFATVDSLDITSGGAPAPSAPAAPLEIRLELTYAYR